MREHIAAILIALLQLGVLFPLASMSQETQTSGIIPYETHAETLDNGLKVIFMPMEGQGLISYWSIVRTGSRDEFEEGRSGFAHFFEHMMFRGTEKFPSELYDEALTTIGANGNAYTTDDLTAYHLSIAAEDLERAIELESDRFKSLSYSKPVFETEAGAVYGEYRKNRTDPLYTLYEAMTATAFTMHPYAHMVIGHENDIAAMPTMYEYSRSFFSRYYRPDNTVIFIAGNVESDSVMELLAEHYGDWAPGYAAPEIPVEPAQQEERRVEVTYEGRTLPYIWLAYKFDRFRPENATYVAADILVDLAFGSTSELYQKLVIDEQVVERLNATTNVNRDPGLLDIYARIKDPERVDYVIESIDTTIAAFQASTPDPERLAAVQSRLKYEFLMGLQTPESIARRLTRYVGVTGGLEGVEALYRTYESITPGDVQNAARLYLDSTRRTVAILRQAE